MTSQAGAIGLALFGTAGGLLIAIPLVFTHVLFKARVAKFEVADEERRPAAALVVPDPQAEGRGDAKGRGRPAAPEPAPAVARRAVARTLLRVSDHGRQRFFDLWFVQANTVTKEVPFHVVTDWIQQGRAVAEDKVKPSGTSDWYPLGTVVAFQPYFPEPEPKRPAGRRRGHGPGRDGVRRGRSRTTDEDEDVDMIPLIDISLVLLIFFMMTMTVAAISRIQVPDMRQRLRPSRPTPTSCGSTST